MEFPFDLKTILGHRKVKVNSDLVPRPFRGDPINLRTCISRVKVILDTMGKASARAQGLRHPVTSADTVSSSQAQRVPVTILGLLKVGPKSLYVSNSNNETCHVTCTCVLDFYVHDTCRRRGYGRELYDHMLAEEGKLPTQVAIDRPSLSMLSFLRNHYGLEHPLHQANNYVLYDGFFGSQGGASQATVAAHSYSDPGYGRYAARKPESTIGKILGFPAPYP